MGNLYTFSTDRIYIFSITADASLSMRDQAWHVRHGLAAYKKEFENFNEACSISVSINRFNYKYYATDFCRPEDVDISYECSGATALYRAITIAAENLLTYVKEVIARTSCVPIATFIFISDGKSEGDDYRKSVAVSAIKKLKEAGINTVFVACGNAITSDFGKEIGFDVTKDIKKGEELETFLGKELSRSCKEQSKSMTSLGTAFFSQANKSQNYSTNTAQVLDDEDWFDI